MGTVGEGQVVGSQAAPDPVIVLLDGHAGREVKFGPVRPMRASSLVEEDAHGVPVRDRSCGRVANAQRAC